MGRPKGALGKTKRSKKIKDVNKPKRAATAYFCYLGHCRRKEHEAGRKVSKVAIFTKQVSEQWRNMDADEKKQFDDEAKVDRCRYEAEMREYRGPKAIKDKDKPKRASSSYFYFLPGFLKTLENSKLAHMDKVKKAGEQWRSMTDDEKLPYEKMAKDDQARYEVEMTEWKKKQASTENSHCHAMAAEGRNNTVHEEEEDEDDDDEEDDDGEDEDTDDE